MPTAEQLDRIHETYQWDELNAAIPDTFPEEWDQVPERQEQHEQKSFDVQASVRMLRHDLERFGRVLPETQKQVCDEELSYLAEGVDRASRTQFVMQRNENDQLVYFKDGQWRPYSSLLTTGTKVARKEAANDFRRSFLVGWAENDEEKGRTMQQLKPGESHTWYSAYPHEMEDKFGPEFMQECGLRPDRKMGFIYQASCRQDGSVLLESQTVDRSDGTAFAAVEAALKHDPGMDLDTATAHYDGAITKKSGEKLHAGRSRTESGEDAWEIINAQKELIQFHLDKLENIAKSNLAGEALDRTIKQHVYGVWATFKKRMDGESVSDAQADISSFNVAPGLSLNSRLELEVQANFHAFAQAGQVLVGCGGSISMMDGENIFNASAKDVFNSIFGGESDKESYSFNKRMFCVDCQAPPDEDEGKKMCGPCGLCRDCDKKYGGDG